MKPSNKILPPVVNVFKEIPTRLSLWLLCLEEHNYNPVYPTTTSVKIITTYFSTQQAYSVVFQIMQLEIF